MEMYYCCKFVMVIIPRVSFPEICITAVVLTSFSLVSVIVPPGAPSKAANQAPLSHRARHNNRSRTPLRELFPSSLTKCSVLGNGAHAATAPSDWLRSVSGSSAGQLGPAVVCLEARARL